MAIDGEELYYQLRAVVEQYDVIISEEADSLIGALAMAIAEGNEQ